MALVTAQDARGEAEGSGDIGGEADDATSAAVAAFWSEECLLRQQASTTQSSMWRISWPHLVPSIGNEASADFRQFGQRFVYGRAIAWSPSCT